MSNDSPTELKILLTGASGFLGSRILQSCSIGKLITTIGRGEGNSIKCDLKIEVPILTTFDAVIHCAGHAHNLPRSERQKKEFFDVNVIGTQNLLNGIEATGHFPNSFIYISSVAVYGVENGEMLDENTTLNPESAYAKSKLEAEKLIQSWCNMHQVNCLILRLPLLVGPNAPGNLGYMQRAIRLGFYLRMGNGSARRSMVAATDVAEFVCRSLGKSGVFHLTDGIHPSYAEIENEIARKYNKRIRSFPNGLTILAARFGDIFPLFPLNSYRLKKLNHTLTFSDNKARQLLGWNVKGIPKSEL